jgi:TPR repeat protein
LDSVKALFRSGDEAGAFLGFKALAELGSAPAMTWLGFTYLEGKGVALDNGAALKWFSMAAAVGDAEAMTWIGYMHFSGRGGVPDKAMAREWYLRAAEAGDAEGQHRLASMLDEAGERDEAERWVRMAAHQGYAPSVEWASNRTAYQMLKERRYGEALPILEKAADSSSAWAHECLGYMYWNGSGVPKDGSRAIQHYEASYNDGRRSVANMIGNLYFRDGRPEAALEWWRKDNQRPISSLYWQHRTIKTHPHLAGYPGEADELLKKAAELGHVLAKRDIAFRMMKGQKNLGTRFEGLRDWLGILPYALGLIRNDESDERLR